MVNISGSVAIAVMMVSIVAQADGLEPDTSDPKLPAIKSIEIKKVAGRSPVARDSDEQCGQFVLSKAEVQRFFRVARAVTQHDYLHMLDWSPCYVSGKLIFADGQTAIWGINQRRAGSLTLSTGRIIYLYCLSCAARGFERTMIRAHPLVADGKPPADIERFVSRREGCDHMRGEIPEPNQEARARQVQREIQRLCAGTDTQLKKLKKKYGANSQIMTTLNEFEPEIEGSE